MKNKSNTILVASSSIDRMTTKPVIDILQQRGYHVILYEADRVVSQKSDFSMLIDNNQGVEVLYGGEPLLLQDVKAAWYRRPAIYAYEQKDKAKQLTSNLERSMIQRTLWDLVPKNAWLNAPQDIRKTDQKLNQLMTAVDIGFKIPRTVASNSWDYLGESLPKDIALKPHNSLSYSRDDTKIHYTKRMVNSPSKLPTETNPFPGIWQEFIEKKHEWRITVVNNTTFDTIVQTSADAKDDWRILQNYESKVQFIKGAFPKKEQDMCHEFLKRFNLKFGAFDFIEDVHGSIHFLECNANGQFGWLEEDLGFDISEAVADQLIAIAEKNEG